MVMAYTNKHNLPLPVVRALTSFEKSEKVDGLRVTTLIDAPRISQLRQRHKAPDEDVSTMLYRILGSAAHLVFQDGAEGLSNSYIPEERITLDVGGVTISGQIDYQYMDDDKVSIIDYKVTAAYSVIYGKPEWEKQLNVYAYLVRHGKGVRVKDLNVCAIIRDYTASKAKTTKGVHKKGRKSALKLFNNTADAEEFASQSSDRKVVERPATYTRCAGNYCRVAQTCDQWRGN